MRMAWQAGHFNWQFIQESFGPEEFEWWIAAYYELGLDGWSQAATIASAAHNAGLWSAAAKGVNIEPLPPGAFRDNIGDTDTDQGDANSDQATIEAFHQAAMNRANQRR